MIIINFGLIHVTFQLFEMGLELSFARLKALAKFAFGMGLTQV
jgi:Kef-type K+ transport system membrane component KefB